MDYYYHVQTKKQLSEVVKNEPNGILLFGEKGVGKSHAAEELAATLLNCKREQLNQNPDFYRVVSTDGIIKIESIREALRIMSYVAVGKTKKVLMIDDANCMTEAAQNALLKTLEEASVHMIFVAHEQLLSTIISRCQLVEFLPPNKKILSDEGKDNLLLALSKGNIGVYTALLEETQFRKDVEAMLEIIGSLGTKRRLLELFHCLKEKDKKHFLDVYGIQYSIYLFEFLQESVFLPFLIKEFDTSVEIDFLIMGYSFDQVLEIMDTIGKHLVQMKSKQYNKNDFFSLLMAFVV